jgi:hypothetical protein
MELHYSKRTLLRRKVLPSSSIAPSTTESVLESSLLQVLVRCSAGPVSRFVALVAVLGFLDHNESTMLVRVGALESGAAALFTLDVSDSLLYLVG